MTAQLAWLGLLVCVLVQACVHMRRRRQARQHLHAGVLLSARARACCSIVMCIVCEMVSRWPSLGMLHVWPRGRTWSCPLPHSDTQPGAPQHTSHTFCLSLPPPPRHPQPVVPSSTLGPNRSHKNHIAPRPPAPPSLSPSPPGATPCPCTSAAWPAGPTAPAARPAWRPAAGSALCPAPPAPAVSTAWIQECCRNVWEQSARRAHTCAWRHVGA